MSVITRLTTAIAEESSAKISGTLDDLDGTGFKPETLTLTLYDQATGEVINSRDAQSILDANGGTVSSAGAFELTLSPDDNVIVGSGRRETHVALIAWTWDSGAKEGRAEVHITIENLANVPAA